jgi:hypothetical protein
MSATRYLRRKPAAHYTNDTYGFGTPSSFAQYASRGDGGPVFRYAGRIPVYAIEDLDAWALAKLSEPVCQTRRKADPKLGEAE